MSVKMAESSIFVVLVHKVRLVDFACEPPPYLSLLVFKFTVFHSACREKKWGHFQWCSQHACGECGRNTMDAGGMLFRYACIYYEHKLKPTIGFDYRCRTCPEAFCTDCLDDDKFDPIGETIPEL